MPEAVCAAVALVATLLAQWTSHWPHLNPDLLLNISARRPISSYVVHLDPGFKLSAPGEAYDGVYYWAIAVDPFARGRAHQLIDLPGYRYGHPLYGWIAGALSGGWAPALPWVFWLLSLATMMGAAWFAGRLVRRLGGSPWWGLAVPASPGLLFSASLDLTEPLQVMLVCAALLVWHGIRQRPRSVTLGVLLALACLAKEQLVLLPVAMALQAVWDFCRHRERLRLASWGALAAGPVAMGLWKLYLIWVMTPQQLRYQSDNISMPFSQLANLFQRATDLRIHTGNGAQIGSTAPSMIMAIFVILAVGTVVGIRNCDALGLFVALNAGLMTCLGWRTLLFPHETLRIPALAVTVALLSLATAKTRYEQSHDPADRRHKATETEPHRPRGTSQRLPQSS